MATLVKTQAASAPPRNFQGIDVPAESVNPGAFFALTRRRRDPEFAATFPGLGAASQVPLRKADILAAIRVRFSGSLVIVGTTVVSTMEWPYNLIKNIRLTANGQSNLANCSGLALKAREFMNNDVTDRGVSQTVGASTVTQGTLSKSSESWGVAANATLTAGTYDVELEWTIPVAEDMRDLAGALFLQTASQDVVVNIDWAQLADLFTGTSGTTDTATLTGNLIVETEKFSIPAVGGPSNASFVVPDLSLFHSMIESRASGVLAIGTNEIRLIGQGAGKQLLRAYYRVLNGSTPSPLAANATNYGAQAWRYGTNETPETYQDGLSMRQVNEDEYGSDIGAVWGWLAHEFNVVNAFRDTVDMGQTSELRLVVAINSGVTLTSAAIDYVQETMFSAE